MPRPVSWINSNILEFYQWIVIPLSRQIPPSHQSSVLHLFFFYNNRSCKKIKINDTKQNIDVLMIFLSIYIIYLNLNYKKFFNDSV